MKDAEYPIHLYEAQQCVGADCLAASLRATSRRAAQLRR